MSAPGNLLSGMGNVLGCSLLPADCSVCGSPLAQLETAPICEACWLEISGPRECCCACCGEDLFQPVEASIGQGAYCRACRMVPPGFVRAVSYGVYDGSMRALIHALKFAGIEPLSRRLGQMLSVAISGFAQETPEGMLAIPVPLHSKRKAERGFNQAERLAAEALRILAQSHGSWKLELGIGALIRERRTNSQAGLTPRQRRQNLRSAFFVADPKRVQGRHVLLIDDIYTTGATARACSQVLLKAGAVSVRVATLARAQRRYPIFPEKRQRYLKALDQVEVQRK